MAREPKTLPLQHQTPRRLDLAAVPTAQLHRIEHDLSSVPSAA